jgi:hypothetical protein
LALEVTGIAGVNLQDSDGVVLRCVRHDGSTITHPLG